MAEKKIDKSRRNFLFGAVRRIKNEKSDGPAASTAEGIEIIKEANGLYVDGNWEDARQKYKESLETDKNDADIRYRLGVCLYRTGKYRQAKLEFERTLRIQRVQRRFSVPRSDHGASGQAGESRGVVETVFQSFGRERTT